MSNIVQLKMHAKELSVLYVEDEKQIRDEISEFLNRFFGVVDLAENGEEGLQRYKENRYDIIITDINMPKINGIEMSEAIKEENPEQSIVVLSAHNESEYLLALINIGVEHYVLKPVNMKQFVKVLNVAVSRVYHTKLFNKYHKKIEEENEQLSHEVTDKTAELENQRNMDTLTGLDNLTSLIRTLEDLNGQKNYFSVIILLDIRSFQFFNDLYGTATGDQILRGFANFLKKFAHNRRYGVYRISGDQFVLFEQMTYIDTDKYEDDLGALTVELKNLSIYLDEFNKGIDIDVTIGISFGQEYPLEHANMALNYAKKNKKSFAVYNMLLDTTDEMKIQFEWKQKIDIAILADQVIPVYQPIVDSDGNIIKYETLMRVIEMDGEEKKLISPLHFLDRAIENQQYDTLSKVVIQKALEDLAANDYVISINLNMDDIKNKLFIDEIYSTIKKDRTGERVIIEITESQSIENYTILKSVIDKFRTLHIRFAIDDFGSGFSNFEHILEIQPEYIKIDGSLVKDIDTNTRANILTNAITRFSHELGIKVIAEYVHSEAIFSILKRFGVDEFQGYYFSEPLIEI